MIMMLSVAFCQCLCDKMWSTKGQNVRLLGRPLLFFCGGHFYGWLGETLRGIACLNLGLVRRPGDRLLPSRRFLEAVRQSQSDGGWVVKQDVWPGRLPDL